MVSPGNCDRLFSTTLAWNLKQWVEQNGPEKAPAVDFASRLKEKEIGVSSEAETALYRVTQEALTNVLRHAGASQVSVVLERHDGFVTVIIEDNGRGFNLEEAIRKNRLGVLGMRERMELVGGTLEVESEPGAGTTVYARVPLRT
jgi:signal transduction histidine kinase